jgi:polyphosphate kinase
MRPGERNDSIFEALKRGDILLHHPYEAFAPVLDLLRQAAADPDVLAIKATLYRVGSPSPVVDALIDAAKAGTEVTVVVELRARFDEAENIDLATRLQEVGAKVVYGIVGFKTHSKMLLVVRREAGQLRRYVHLGTGNYHAGTARTYTDLGLLTARTDIGKDVDELFLQLTGLGSVRRLSKILQSPFTLMGRLLELIEGEAERARRGEPAYIAAKMNALTMPEMIRALYRASQAGVSIDLIVRGACCLRPGVPGVSESIRVRSIVGRFLEHSRLFYFHAGGEGLLFASSADWMTRNLVRRVEACFPIEDVDLKQRAERECIDLCLADDAQAWIMQSDGSYERALSSDNPHAVQDTLLEEICGLGNIERRPPSPTRIEI